MSFTNKIKALLNSRRFWVAVFGVLGIVIQDIIPFIDESQITAISNIMIGWIVGDSIYKTGGISALSSSNGTGGEIRYS